MGAGRRSGNLMELHVTRWIHRRADAGATLVAAAASPHLFSAEGQIYSLFVHPNEHTPNTFEFTWTPQRCGLMPPLEGIAVIRHVGPLTALTLHASYTIAPDVASRLAHEALGRRVARGAIACASKALAVLIASEAATRTDFSSSRHEA